MTARPTRRHVLGAAAGAAGLGDLSAFLPLSSVRAGDAPLTPDLVRFTPDLEPLVRLVEETPQEKCLEAAVGQLRDGVPLRRLVAALFLAAVRSGTAHDVFVVHAAHQLALDAADEQLLPVLWAAYHLGGMRLRKRPGALGDLPPLKGALPAPEKAAGELDAAAKAGDGERAERAVVALVRAEGAHRVADALWPVAVRSGEDTYHNAICAANCWRTLRTIGWAHAEPVLRRVVGYLAGKPDRSFPTNEQRVRKAAGALPPGWAGEARDPGLTRELLALLRGFRREDACDLAADRLSRGKAQAGSVWDAVHLAAAEIMVRKPVPGHGCPVHANTTVNAQHFAFRVAADPAVRLLVLLQAVGWQCNDPRDLAAQAARDPRFRLRDLRIDEFPAGEVPDRPEDAVREVLAAASGKPEEAAPKAFAYGRKFVDHDAFFRAARRLLVQKATRDAHDLKFPAAVFEDYGLVAPEWRPHLLAAAVHGLKGADAPDSPVLRAAREAIKTL